jgi:AcrR family transcriptional regulator
LPTSIQNWIEAGYELFSVNGPDGVQVEKLARMLDLNKSGFYHHFGDREGLFTFIVQHHSRMNEQFYNGISAANSFSPGFLNLVIKYRTAVLVQMQLRKHSDVPMFRDAFQAAKKRNTPLILPLWEDYLKISGNPALSKELYTIFQDVFFMRIANEDLTFKLAEGIAMNFLRIISAVKLYGIKLNTPKPPGI